ncbi:hypothetical protein ZIOFF_054098 [Zingiber officinale]|uniref:Protein BCCIP homolog n=1 Tax=Zingiber officinale TaxID=94328 RepID=A0A8J5KJ58_ZINOF|nr:hypothetical protein ZIOFF_054098 [Zingiber officinale]
MVTLLRKHMNHQRPSKRHGVPILRPFLGFSSFARTILFSRSAPAYSLSAFTKSPVDEVEEQEVDMVHADFGFFDPKLGDFSGVKLLLHNYLDNKPWDLSGFVDLILEQTTDGTVVKLDEQDEVGHTDDDDDDDAGPFGVITALNLQRYQELPEFLLEACTEETTKKKLKTYLERQAGDVGLLVSQRFVNCPYQLVPPLYDALFDEISWATEDEELRDSFCFKYYVLVTRIFESKTINQSKANLKGDDDFSDSIIYTKPEDEIFREMKNYKEKGLAMVIDASEVSKIREKLNCLLTEC